MNELNSIDASMKHVNRETLIGWVVFYYLDGKLVKYTSDAHNWKDLPSIGVQYLFRVYESHKEQISGCDYYCPYQLMGVEDVRPWIKFGLYLDDEVFNNDVWPVVKNDDINK